MLLVVRVAEVPIDAINVRGSSLSLRKGRRVKNILGDQAAFANCQISILQRRELPKSTGSLLEIGRSHSVLTRREFDRVLQAEFFQQPRVADAARRLQKPKSDRRHDDGGESVFFVPEKRLRVSRYSRSTRKPILQPAKIISSTLASCPADLPLLPLTERLSHEGGA